MRAFRGKRKEGACVQCALRKRKCDLRRPRCSQCRKSNSICEPRTFKHYKIPRNPRSRPATTSRSLKSTKSYPGLSQAQYGIDPGKEPSENLPGPSVTGKSPSRDDTNRPACIEGQQTTKPAEISIDKNTTDNSSTSFNRSVSLPPPTSSPPAIPPPLSIPSDLFNHPQHSFLWSYFIVRGTKIFLCWDVGKLGLNELINDPFTTTLSTMAAHSEVLRPAAFALSAFLYNQDCPGSLSRHDIIAFKDAALAAFRHGNVDPQKSPIDYILASLILQLVEMNHDQGLSSLARRALAYLPDQIDSPSRDVAMHLSRWMYICRQLSCSNNTDLTDEVAWHDLEFHDTELESSFCRQFRTWIIHPLYTVSHRWINPLLKLSRLVRLQQNTRKAGVISQPGDLNSEVNELEDEILQARQQDLLAFLQGSEDLPDLVNLNEAMHAAITLVFWTRLRDMPWTHRFARKQVLEVCSNIRAISQYSRALNNAVFPIFLAGCEAVDSDVRNTIERTLHTLHPAGFWYRQQSRLIANLQHIWTIRDDIPGARWPEWSQKVLLGETICIPV